MKISPTKIPEVLIFEPAVHGDSRGYFMETWRKSHMEDQGLNVEFVQDNQSSSSQGILRGLHYQLNQPQGKLVRVVSGEIYDVAVDMRHNSKTFGEWVGVLLSAENKKQLWVPPGFAHGFYVTSKQAEMTYKCTDYYNHGDEYSLLWNDQKLAIDWPLSVPPVLSEKDQQGLVFSAAPYYL